MEKRYEELITLPTFHQRFLYLQEPSSIGKETFGDERIENQNFYKSSEWKRVRRIVILRDYGCDLGIKDCPIAGNIYVHHMNPITLEDLINRPEYCLDPNYLISMSFDTHNKIHYGIPLTEENTKPVIRTPFDTCPWRLT